MAKPRKPKSSDGAAATAPAASKPENSGAVVRHQKLCLSIDLARRQIYGYTELEIAVPDIGIAGLYAENLGIESVFVDGEPTEFEYYPRQHHSSEDSEKRWSSLVTNPSSAADAAGAVYTLALERELVPNLLINCCKAAFRVANEQQDQVQENLGSNGVGDVQVNLESNGVEPSAGEGRKQSNGMEPASREGTNLSNGVEPTAGEGMNQSNGVEPSEGEGVNQSIGVEPSAGVETKQNVKVVRVNYWVEKAETGIHFDDNVVHTDNQIRRARCWFPCIDEGFQRCCYDLEFTVPHNLVAVSTGSLLYQVLRKDDPPSKTYVYRLDVPVTAQWISLVVAPFEILPDPHVGLISHMCLPANSSKLRNAVEFFHYAFNYYEEYLDAKFPFGSYTQVFLDPDMAVSSSSLGASVGIFSSQVLYDEKVLDQTIDTSIKLALALAKQWFGAYIAPEGPNDEWLMDGLAGFLTDLYIKKFLGNNEARYRRFKANCAICKADDGGATTLSSTASCKDLYGTHRIGLYGKIRSWKSVAILQMLEKQMGPESFRKILQKVVSRARDVVPLRTLSTKEFRHFTTKVGNLERPFVKEFFSRWVCSCGCPVLRMGFSYNKKKNMVELAVLRECTATPDASASIINPDSENRDGEIGWPGMMSIRVYELDGMYDHPVLPLAGDMWQLLEIQCHSKLAARRFQKAKKGSKPDGSDENGDVPAADMRSSLESPLLWIRADPEMEYLAQLHFNQPVQMWINQLEKDGDVIAQAQAITALEALPQLSFSVVNALNNFLCDSKGFWRVRIEAAFALANSASEDTDWAGLLHLVKFYKSRRFDATIGLPKPNDFHDFPEYFVLEAIPHAVAMVRATDKKSPREAVEFVLQLLKHNDNTGNPYSDVFWLAALVQSVGELEFGQQSLVFLSSLLKRIDRLLQFDRLMPSYNGILTVSCIRTLVQIALKLSGSLHLDHVSELIKPFWNLKTVWQIRIEAGRALLDLESHCRGIDAALSLFIRCLGEEPSLRGQAKLGAHALHLCQMLDGCHSNNDVKSSTLLALLHLIEGHTGFNNIFLRHHLFCILQILAGRAPTLYGVPREKASRVGDAGTGIEQKNFFTALIMETRPAEAIGDIPKAAEDSLAIPEVFKETDTVSNNQQPIIDLTIPELPREADTVSNDRRVVDLTIPEGPKEATIISHIDDQMILAVPDAPKDPDTVSNGHEYRKPVVKIRVKRSAASSRAEDADNQTVGRSQGRHSGIDRGASSSISVDAPHRISAEAASISNHNVEEVNSYLDHGSRMTASIGSAKFVGDGDNFGKELQCTAESSKISMHPQADDPSSSSVMQDNNVDTDAQKFASLQTLSTGRVDLLGGTGSPFVGKEIEKKKDQEKKRKREDHKGRHNDAEYLERKRLKKEKRKREKGMAKLVGDGSKASPVKLPSNREEPSIKLAPVQPKPSEPSSSKGMAANVPTPKPEKSEGSSAPRFKIKIRNRTPNKL